MNTTPPPYIDDETAKLIANVKENPDIAHFLADIGSGTSPEECIKTHFGHYFKNATDEAAETSPEEIPTAKAEIESEVKTEVGMYQSELRTNTNNNQTDTTLNFLQNIRPGFWDI